MYAESEYRVRPVVRYIVTRYTPPRNFTGLQGEPIHIDAVSSVIAEVHHEGIADEICQAMQAYETDIRSKNADLCPVTGTESA